MWLLLTFIIIWALSPGPVAALTIHESRKNGLMAGVTISAGAAITSTLMVLMALVFHTAGFSTIMESDNLFMTMIERAGASAIILMGVYAGYKSLLANDDEASDDETSENNKFGLLQGMMVMATYIPQALVYYNVIIPQTVEPQTIITAIIMLGTLKVVLIFGWHAIIAFIATRSQSWMANKRFSKFLEVSTAFLITGLGINILI